MAKSMPDGCIQADWPAPENVRALTSTRKGGFSKGSYAGLNLAQHVEDEAPVVARNRDFLLEHFGLPAAPVWLQQTHSNTVIIANDYTMADMPPEADAAWTSDSGIICAVLTADCLPVFFTSQQGDRVAVAHAGWRGVHNGVISHCFAATGIAPEDCLVWLGPAIGAEVFEVGAEVYDAFAKKNPENTVAFEQKDAQHWLCDIYQLARIELQQLGIQSIYGGGLCTYSDENSFYSFRRDGARTGRMASLIWIEG
ncbi:MAG: peptidoglycan editing factor PgeF [Gammaproteobacteria bacterium]|nr:peptidoglycan editing factor PgeF [Gammaproteobacteria bacterium]